MDGVTLMKIFKLCIIIFICFFALIIDVNAKEVADSQHRNFNIVHKFDEDPYDFAEAKYIYCGPQVYFPAEVGRLTRPAILILKLITPIIIIILGSIDFARAVAANKAEDISKGQKKFIQRLIAGALVFLVITVVQFVITVAADNGNDQDLLDCIDCLITNKDSCKIEDRNPFIQEVPNPTK